MTSQLQPRPTPKRSRSELSRSATPAPIEPDTEELKLSLPEFLRQPASEIRRKFEYIQELEEGRHDSFRSDPEPDPTHPWAQEISAETFRRNRYTDIIPWAQSRIHLKAPAGQTDYINASPISLLRSDDQHELQYIATQGPKQTGVDHFWQMVWHECGKVAVVIMLTKLNEGTREKCFQYYPSADDQTPRPSISLSTTPTANATLNPQTQTSPSSRASITDLSTSTQPALQLTLTSDDGSEDLPGSVTLIDTKWDESSQAVIRKLSILRGDEMRIVYHLQFSGWPDYGVPQGRDRSALLSLIRLSNEKNDGEQEKSPRVVHCSAGVGRTGTFMSLEHLIGELDNGAFDDVRNLKFKASEHQPMGDDADDVMVTWPDPVFDTVALLREQRPTMVQSLVQFHFIYEILADEWLKRRKRILEEKRQMAEPSPKALRLGRGLKKMLHLGRDKPVGQNGSANSHTQGLSVHVVRRLGTFGPSGFVQWTMLGICTSSLVIYIAWQWRRLQPT